MIRIRTLGGLSVSRDGTALAGAATQARRLAVLALIARSGERGITRERLLAMLWPDSEEEGARRALSQALHALRTDLGADDLFLGVQELRLNLAAATCDVLELDAALATQSWERAAAAYGGPFLEGFRLAGASEFDRWMEEQREHLAHRHADALERLGEGAEATGDRSAAVGWWRKRAALDPLNGRVTIRLMRALNAAGERHAALQQARIYEALMEQELALAPDAEVMRLAEEIRRRGGQGGQHGQGSQETQVEQEGQEQAAVERESIAVAPVELLRAPARRFHVTAGVVLLAALGIGAGVFWRGRARTGTTPVLAVGAIADYRGSGARMEPLTDMLATNLARVAGIQVVSSGRLLEVIASRRDSATAPAYAAAAKQARASELLEGGVHALADGRLLLELRRVNLASGTVASAYRLEGDDAFALVEKATEAIAASLGKTGVGLHPGDVSTRSIVAYRFYEEGLRTYAQANYRGALELFRAALREDSTFAMAAYYLLRSRYAFDTLPDSANMEWLAGLSSRASERERLQIRGWIAFMTQSPALDAIADTLAIRYPAEVEGQLLAGFARMARADFAEALPYLHRVVQLDSSAMGSTGARCLACEASGQLVYAYLALDSIDRMEALARDWLRRNPKSGPAWDLLGEALDRRGRYEEAHRARSQSSTPREAIHPAAISLREGKFAEAEVGARAVLARGRSDEAHRARWLLIISYRYQGRWQEAAAMVRESWAALSPADRSGDRGRGFKANEALVLLESGQPRAAATLLDSMTRNPEPGAAAGVKARFLTNQYTLLTEAAASAGDTALASSAADSATAWGARSGKTRDLRIAAHARALRQLWRGDTTDAMAGFSGAIYSTTMGYTRSSWYLARLLVARRRPAEAAPLLRAALRGSLESGNLYVTHTELHELLGRAYAETGQRDSARVHLQYVVTALAQSDAGARPRLIAAQERLARLGTVGRAGR